MGILFSQIDLNLEADTGCQAVVETKDACVQTEMIGVDFDKRKRSKYYHINPLPLLSQSIAEIEQLEEMLQSEQAKRQKLEDNYEHFQKDCEDKQKKNRNAGRRRWQNEKKKKTQQEQQRLNGMEDGLNELISQVEAINEREAARTRRVAEKEDRMAEIREKVWLEEMERQKFRRF